MPNHDTNSPEFSSKLRKLEVSDKGHADVFNDLFNILINNDVALLKKIENNKLELPENIVSATCFDTRNAKGIIVDNNECFTKKCFKCSINSNENNLVSFVIENKFSIPFTIGIKIKFADLINVEKDCIKFYENELLINTIKSSAITAKEKWIYRNISYIPKNLGETTITIKTNALENTNVDVLLENIYILPIGLSALV